MIENDKLAASLSASSWVAAGSHLQASPHSITCSCLLSKCRSILRLPTHADATATTAAARVYVRQINFQHHTKCKDSNHGDEAEDRRGGGSVS